eukprot:4517000-Amphidinium_carterae.1
MYQNISRKPSKVGTGIPKLQYWHQPSGVLIFSFEEALRSCACVIASAVLPVYVFVQPCTFIEFASFAIEFASSARTATYHPNKDKV